MKVRATKFGFYLHKRRSGDVFDFEGIPSKTWMEPVDDAAFKAFGMEVKPDAPEAPVAKGRGRKKPDAPEAPEPVAAPEGAPTGDQDVI